MNKIKAFYAKISKHKATKYATDFLFIAVGTFLMGIAYSIFLTPYDITPSGFSGLSNIISLLIMKLTGFYLYPAIIYLVLNAILFLFAFKNHGIKFCVYAAIGIGLYSLFMEVCKFDLVVTNDLLLCSIIGGVIMGIGLGMVVRVGSSTGGCDMLATMVNRFLPSVTTGQIIFIVDVLVIGTSIFVYGLANALYALIGIYISTRATDIVIDGVKAVRAYYIISDKTDEIRDAVHDNLHRGATEIKALGYEKNEKSMLLCLVRRNQVAKLKDIIKEIDEKAFVFCTTVREAIGNGFYTKPEKKKLFKRHEKKQDESVEPKTKKQKRISKKKVDVESAENNIGTQSEKIVEQQSKSQIVEQQTNTQTDETTE